MRWARLILATRGVSEHARAKSGLLGPFVPQPFSPVLISSVCSDKGKEASRSRRLNASTMRAHIRVAAFSSRGIGGLSSSNLASAASRSASSNSSQRLISVAFDRQKVDHAPLGVEALVRGPMRRWVTTAPRLLSRCTARCRC